MSTLAPHPRLLKRKSSSRNLTASEGLRTSFESIQAILTLPRKQRTLQQIHQLLQFTRPFKIFSELAPEAHLQCCQCLAYSFTESGKVTAPQYVFREGDKGTNFYIILQGVCAVLESKPRADGRMEDRQVTTLRSGECFGELALISNQPRLASILCREDSHFAILSRDDYNSILAKAHDRLIRAKIDLLTRHAVFKKLSKGAITRLTYFFRILKFNRKQTVFAAGSPAVDLFMVKEGEFQLTKDVEMMRVMAFSPRVFKPSHCSIDVTLLGVGELLGSEDVLANRPYSYTCRCHSTVGEVMAISRKDFFQLLGNEEMLSYMSSLNAAKEVYRTARIATATQVEREKHSTATSPQQSYSTELRTRKKALSTSKSRDASAQKTGSLSQYASPRHTRTPSIAVIPSFLDRSEPQISSKPPHKGKSWSQVFCSKYSIAEKPPTAKGKSALVVNFHTFSLKKQRLRRFQGFVHGGGGSTRMLANLSESLLRVRLTDVSQMDKSPGSLLTENRWREL